MSNKKGAREVPLSVAAVSVYWQFTPSKGESVVKVVVSG
jgi:hypothetical protein